MSDSVTPGMISTMRGFIERLRELEDEGLLSERDTELLEGLKKLTTDYMTDVRVTISGNCQLCCAPIEFDFSKMDRVVPGGGYGDNKYVKCKECGATNVTRLTMQLIAVEGGEVIERIKARIYLRAKKHVEF